LNLYTLPQLCWSVSGAVKNILNRSLPFTTVKQKLAPVNATPYSLIAGTGLGVAAAVHCNAEIWRWYTGVEAGPEFGYKYR
jgi:hypothetical protein